MQTETLTRQPTALPDEPFSTGGLVAHAVSQLGRARCEMLPFRHWRFQDVLPRALCEAIIRLPIGPVPIGDTFGKRDSHNDVRRFFSPKMQSEFPVVGSVTQAFQHPLLVDAIRKLCGVDLSGSYLRIEYCQDADGFWLEPHMDIKEKHITMQLYLNTGPGADTLGTDLYDGNRQFFCSAPSTLGEGMAFVPREPESWHGFEKRTIPTVRRSLIVNYVTDDWRARHELAFPDRKIA